jgi:hypothetical protein
MRLIFGSFNAAIGDLDERRPVGVIVTNAML